MCFYGNDEIMDLSYLLHNADSFAYEYRKHFTEDEMPVKHFVYNEGVLIVTTKKICIFYYDKVIRFVDDLLQNTSVKITGENYEIMVNNKKFSVKLGSVDDEILFENYYQKFKNM